MPITNLHYSGELVVLECWCGIHHAVPETLRGEQRRQYDAGSNNVVGIYCPLGHQHVPTGETERDRRLNAEAREQHLKDQLQAAEAEAEKRRQQIVRDRHRIANGVCPCCNRSFENVRRHITAQHPDFDPGPTAGWVQEFKCSCGRSFETLRGLRSHQGHRRDVDGSSYDWRNPKAGNYWRHLTVVPS